jgi:hypothetical protein
MNPKHRRFAEEFAVDHNGAQSAMRAGYSENRAKQTAHRLLARSDIASMVEKLDAEKREQLGFGAQDLLEKALELHETAMGGKPRTYRDQVVRDENGEVIYDPNLTAASKALDLVARRLGLLSDRPTVEHVGNVVYTLDLGRTLDDSDDAEGAA